MKCFLKCDKSTRILNLSENATKKSWTNYNAFWCNNILFCAKNPCKRHCQPPLPPNQASTTRFRCCIRIFPHFPPPSTCFDSAQRLLFMSFPAFMATLPQRFLKPLMSRLSSFIIHPHRDAACLILLIIISVLELQENQNNNIYRWLMYARESSKRKLLVRGSL